MDILHQNKSLSPSKNLSSWLKFRSNKSSDSIGKNENIDDSAISRSLGSPNSTSPSQFAKIGDTGSPQEQGKDYLSPFPQPGRPTFGHRHSSGGLKTIKRLKSPVKKQSALQAYSNTSKESSDSAGNSYKQYRDDFLRDKHQFHGQVFGVSLQESLKTSSAEVILQCDQVAFGRIPIVVAKCGSFLKKNGLDHSGIFRIAGNNKRVKNLQYIFSTPPSYGLSFNEWEANNFTVHDAATILRRYLNHLEEPLVPLKFYNNFRDPLKSRPRILKNMKKGNSNFFTKQEEIDLKLEKIRLSSLSHEEKNKPEIIEKRLRNQNKRKLIKDIRGCLKEYENCFINLLDDDSKQVLIYLLDLLSLFAQHSEKNLMSSKNLAAIFQPSLLSHPDHDMNPSEYELSRFCVEFLIDFSYKLLPHILDIPKHKIKKTSLGSSNVETSNMATVGSNTGSTSQTISPPTNASSFSSNAVSIPRAPKASIRRAAGRPHSKSLTAKPTVIHDVLRIVNKDPDGDDDCSGEEDEDESDFPTDVANNTVEEDCDEDDANDTTIDYQEYMNDLGFEPISLVGSTILSTATSPIMKAAEMSSGRPKPPKMFYSSTSSLPPSKNQSHLHVPPPRLRNNLSTESVDSTEKMPKLKKRDSWFQKIKSHSSFSSS